MNCNKINVNRRRIADTITYAMISIGTIGALAVVGLELVGMTYLAAFIRYLCAS